MNDSFAGHFQPSPSIIRRILPRPAHHHRTRRRYHHCKTFIPTDMKQHCPLLLAGALAFAIINLSSCKKAFDYIDHHRDELAKCCQVQAMTVQFEDIYSPMQHMIFTYDDQGKPVKIEAQDPDRYGYNAFHFRYDNKGRLSDYMLTDAKLTFVYIWQHFSYPVPQTVIDSVFNYEGDINDNHTPSLSALRGITKINLDGKGRISKYTPLLPASEAGVVQYDANGNLILPGVKYDNKVNIYQTNPVWQFVYGNYSRNNAYIPPRISFPASIPSYNQYGLPLEFYYPVNPPSFLFGFPYAVINITYDCDLPKTPKDL
jgi:hypothetical protein